MILGDEFYAVSPQQALQMMMVNGCCCVCALFPMRGRRRRNTFLIFSRIGHTQAFKSLNTRVFRGFLRSHNISALLRKSEWLGMTSCIVSKHSDLLQISILAWPQRGCRGEGERKEIHLV